MISPEFPKNEKQRQFAVEKYRLLDTLPEESFDNITTVMSYICQTPISLISLLDKDRNFLKSHHGIGFSESPRDLSFCGHAINSSEDITIVTDARKDVRFEDNPLVTEYNAIFYAGVPLVNPDGYKLGTLCVYDHKPRELAPDQIKALKAMAKQVEQLFEQRYQTVVLEEAQKELASRYQELEKFANLVSHDLKSPLANIISLNGLIQSDPDTVLSSDSTTYLNLLEVSADALKDYIDGLLIYYKSDFLSKKSKENLTFLEIMSEMENMTSSYSNFRLKTRSEDLKLLINKSVLVQILMNLVVNAIKYNDKEIAEVTIDVKEDEASYFFSVEDNGIGIASAEFDRIFQLFTIIDTSIYGQERGSGIGLATVKQLINKQGGQITVSSEVGNGSVFRFDIRK